MTSGIGDNNAGIENIYKLEKRNFIYEISYMDKNGEKNGFKVYNVSNKELSNEPKVGKFVLGFVKEKNRIEVSINHARLTNIHNQLITGSTGMVKTKKAEVINFLFNTVINNAPISVIGQTYKEKVKNYITNHVNEFNQKDIIEYNEKLKLIVENPLGAAAIKLVESLREKFGVELPLIDVIDEVYSFVSVNSLNNYSDFTNLGINFLVETLNRVELINRNPKDFLTDNLFRKATQFSEKTNPSEKEIIAFREVVEEYFLKNFANSVYPK